SLTTTHLFVLSVFECSAHPPGLPSFPTRRSSDLMAIWHPKQSSASPRTRTWTSTRRRSRSERNTSLTSTRGPSSTRAWTTRRSRSEEHTSELQSRFDLVCRLLLEKKKRKLHDHTT